MKTVHEVSELAGVSIRTLQYYDKIGLLHPSERTDSGYRLYGDVDLERLQQILLFRELAFPLKEIKKIIRNPQYDRNQALDQQIALLTLKKEHIENLIVLARNIRTRGEKTMDFSAFDTKKMDEYAAKAKSVWGNTSEYKEFEEKDKNRIQEEQQDILNGMMDIFIEFGALKTQNPGSDEAQAMVKQLRDFITEHFYTCSDTTLAGLGKMYAVGGDFTKNINAAAGEGTAEFAAAAIEIFCK